MRRKDIPSVQDVKIIPSMGPWPTKSDAYLNVLFSMSRDETKDFFTYDVEKLSQSDRDIGGSRLYLVRPIFKGKIGGREWHKVRKEMIFVLEGSFTWKFEDLHGEKRQLTRVNSEYGVSIPPLIMHTYIGEENKNSLLVVCNTILDSDDPRTHDSFSNEEFEELKADFI